MMKKLLFMIVLLLGCLQANAQFETGRWFLNTSLTGLDLSHRECDGTDFGFALNGGTFVAKNVALCLNFRGKYQEKGIDETTLGLGARYYASNCGVYCGLGGSYKHFVRGEDEEKDNTFCVTPEIGYAFFLNGTVTIEPSLFYDLSFRKCKEYSNLGFKIGFAFYF